MNTLIRKSMTYGKLPTKREYEKAFREDIIGGFKFRNDERVGDITLNEYELWNEIKRAIKEYRNGNEDSGQWVSDVLFVLGFEWI